MPSMPRRRPRSKIYAKNCGKAAAARCMQRTQAKRASTRGLNMCCRPPVSVSQFCGLRYPHRNGKNGMTVSSKVVWRWWCAIQNSARPGSIWWRFQPSTSIRPATRCTRCGRPASARGAWGEAPVEHKPAPAKTARLFEMAQEAEVCPVAANAPPGFEQATGRQLSEEDQGIWA